MTNYEVMFILDSALEEEAKAIENAVVKVLEDGYRTKDIYSEGTTLVGTRKMGQLVIERLSKV